MHSTDQRPWGLETKLLRALLTAILNFVGVFCLLSFQMWYEALPGLIIIGSCITFTGWSLKIVDRLFQEGKVNEEKQQSKLKRSCVDFNQVEFSTNVRTCFNSFVAQQIQFG